MLNIKGNDYRLVVAVDFEKSIVWIKPGKGVTSSAAEKLVAATGAQVMNGS